MFEGFDSDTVIVQVVLGSTVMPEKTKKVVPFTVGVPHDDVETRVPLAPLKKLE